MKRNFSVLMFVCLVVLFLVVPLLAKNDFQTTQVDPNQSLAYPPPVPTPTVSTQSVVWEVARLAFCQHDTPGKKKYLIRGIAYNFSTVEIDVNVTVGNTGTSFTYNVPVNSQNVAPIAITFETDNANTVTSAQLFGNGTLFNTIPSSSFKFYSMCNKTYIAGLQKNGVGQ